MTDNKDWQEEQSLICFEFKKESHEGPVEWKAAEDVCCFSIRKLKLH